MPVVTEQVVLKKFECAKCHHRWQRRSKHSRGLPKICPACKRPNWNDGPKAQAASN